MGRSTLTRRIPDPQAPPRLGGRPGPQEVPIAATMWAMLQLDFAAEALGRCRLFDGMSPDSLLAITRSLKARRFRRGEVLFHEGDPGDALFVVSSGAVKVVVPSEDGEEAILATLRRGDFLGELALLDGAPRSASAIALERTEALTLPRDQFRTLVDSDPAIRDALLVALAGELRRLTAHVAELHFLDLAGRLAARLARLAEDHGERLADGSIRLDAPLTQSDLAAMIGATRQSVNKLLGEFEAAGLLTLERDSIVVTSIEKLAEASRR
jgi:CRP/FNR family cyclic AMP-dependent transcriptional regulator